jgi:hypothetical protein
MFTSYEGNFCFIKMFMTWMFCLAEDNKIISGIENTITNRTEKYQDFQPTSTSQGL